MFHLPPPPPCPLYPLYSPTPSEHHYPLLRLHNLTVCIPHGQPHVCDVCTRPTERNSWDMLRSPIPLARVNDGSQPSRPPRVRGNACPNLGALMHRQNYRRRARSSVICYAQSCCCCCYCCCDNTAPVHVASVAPLIGPAGTGTVLLRSSSSSLRA